MEEKEKTLDVLNQKCAECMRLLSEYGGPNEWYCLNLCPTGYMIHKVDEGSDWDKLDKQTYFYRRTTDGD